MAVHVRHVTTEAAGSLIAAWWLFVSIVDLVRMYRRAARRRPGA